MSDIKKYLKVKFKLVSPLIIGCGKNENTDNDVLTDSTGFPYIPGTAMAGVIRSAVSESGVISEATEKNVFGDVHINNKAGDSETDAKESRLIFYDAHLIKQDIEKYNISIRDSVALDEYKTARDGAKFDMEVLEPGVSFETFIEINIGESDEEEKVWDLIKSIWKTGSIYFGGKTTRGMGAVELKEIKEAVFDFSEKEKIESWIEFDMYGERQLWKDITEFVSPVQAENVHEIKLGLKLNGGISIRRYTTGSGDSEDAEADYSQLTVKNTECIGYEDKTDYDKKFIPVIPGTTWAGAFRHRITELLEQAGEAEAKEKVSLFFGDIKAKENADKKSKITFSESQIRGGSSKTVTRNAIDRFTGGASDGALYTEKMYYGGNTKLTIRIKGDKKEEFKSFVNALAAAIADLHGGYLAVGGLTSVGRGLFEVTAINDDEVEKGMSAADIYNKIKAVI